jgi:hypothetical protein
MPETEIKRLLHATGHCRHYSYKPGEGPQCAKGVDMGRHGANQTRLCMPNPPVGENCHHREEYTEAERVAWQEFAQARAKRVFLIMGAIPGSQRDRGSWGKSGTIKCPACEAGTVRWARARSNGHVYAICSTAYCCQFVQ